MGRSERLGGEEEPVPALFSVFHRTTRFAGPVTPFPRLNIVKKDHRLPAATVQRLSVTSSIFIPACDSAADADRYTIIENCTLATDRSRQHFFPD